jgi:hypothetical protein
MLPILEDCKTVMVFIDHVSQVQGLLLDEKLQSLMGTFVPQSETTVMISEIMTSI